MKKILAIILVCATLLSMSLLPISADGITPSSTGKAATNVVGKTITVDGEMGENEGWGEAVGILNKYRNISGDASVKERGKVYVSYDASYVYYFVEIDSDFVDRDINDSNSEWVNIAKANFGTLGGVEERSAQGATKSVDNKGVSEASYKTWTSDADENEVSFYCKKDSTYRVEWRFPIPEAAKKDLRARDFELGVSIYQGIGKGSGDSKAGGTFLSDTVETNTSLPTVRGYSISVTLPKFVDETGAQETTFAKMYDLSDKAVLIDGYDYEGWAHLDYSLLKYSFGTEGAVVPEGSQSKVRLGTDGQYVYVYYETLRVNYGTSPVVYIYMNFPNQGGTKRITTYVGGDDIGTVHTNQFGTGATYAVLEGESTTVLEVRVEIPEADRETLQAAEITNAWINIIERYDISSGAESTGMASAEDSSWGATTRYTIPQIDPIEDTTVKRIANTVTVDGAMGADEGWAETPYMRLDSTKGTTYYGTPSKLYLSTDGEYLYVFFESAKENWTSKNNCQLYFYIDYETDDVIQVRFKFDGTCDTVPFIYQHDADNTLDTSEVTTQILCGTDKATLEFKLPIPDGDQTILETRPANIQIGVFEKEVAWGGNNGKAPSEGSSFAATIPVQLPAATVTDNGSRFVGVQWRENPDDNGATRDVRFIAAIGDYKAYEQIGFDFTMNGISGSVNCLTVYDSIVADGVEIFAENYGGKYFFAYTLSGFEKGQTYTLSATSYTKMKDGEKVSGDTFEVTVTIDAEGNLTFS